MKGTREEQMYFGAFLIDATPRELVDGSFRQDITSDWPRFVSEHCDGFKIDFEAVTRSVSNILKYGYGTFEDREFEEITVLLSGRWLMKKDSRKTEKRIPKVLLSNRGSAWQVLRADADERKVRGNYVCHTICKRVVFQQSFYLPEEFFTA